MLVSVVRWGPRFCLSGRSEGSKAGGHCPLYLLELRCVSPHGGASVEEPTCRVSKTRPESGSHTTAPVSPVRC